jgi:alpha-amylase/alpha-mannosidase (GH57 family)
MSRIYVCFLWHMHQPCYKDLISGEYKLPWTRLHALKDYYGMVRILEEFPKVRQTFNLVPSLVAQVEEYASGQAQDPFLRCALKASEDLSQEEQNFIVRYFFQANPSRLIYRYPRYGELYDAWMAADGNMTRARQFFSPQAFRDLQVLSQLAWFDEEFLARDEAVQELVRKGRDYTLEDQVLMGQKQDEILNAVLPVYKEFAAKGQIELSTTPFYHPILPLLCDSDIAGISHPYVPLPSRFQYRRDARSQVERARSYMQDHVGQPIAGLWPSEGSVSDEVLAIASQTGFRWIATDDGVLARTLGSTPGPEQRYRPYVWRQENEEMRVVFRDHFLSDLIGFVYMRMGAEEAANDFLSRIHENCRSLVSSGRDALVPIILDGENAWEYYEQNGRPFLRQLYRRISDDPMIEALTIGEAVEKLDPQYLDHIFPGSWINSNFDIWIGDEEDNRAWEYLLRARQTYDYFESLQEEKSAGEKRRLALEELFIAEGSDWCWWYGPEHDTVNRLEFDQLFRAHLANVYHALGLPPPDELSRPILKTAVKEFHAAPSGPIQATIDGEVTSFFEWLGAGLYRVDSRTGAMHGHRYLIRELHYGCDGWSLYLRLDFENISGKVQAGTEVRFNIQPASDRSLESSLRLRFEDGGISAADVRLAADPGSGIKPVEFAFHRILELRLSFASLGVKMGQSLRLRISIWQNSLPLDALPQQGWLECSTAEPTDWPV